MGGKDRVGAVAAANSPIPILIPANGWKGPSLRGGGSRKPYSMGLVSSMGAPGRCVPRVDDGSMEAQRRCVLQMDDGSMGAQMVASLMERRWG